MWCTKHCFIKKLQVFLLVFFLIAINSIILAANKPNLTMSVPFMPIPVKSDGLIKFGYELEISPFKKFGLTLTKAEVLNADTKKVLLQLDSNALKQFYHSISKSLLMAKQYKDDGLKLKQPRISFWVRVKPNNVPKKIIHRLTFRSNKNDAKPIIIYGGETKLRSDFHPLVFASPLKGAGWLAHETMFSPEAKIPIAHHFLLQYTVNNVTHVPFRYAVDLVLLDPHSHVAFRGNRKQNKSWYGYGKEVYAVINGIVVVVQDKFHDNPQVGIMGHSPTGNHVIIDHGDGQYVGYAHFMFGSIKVKVGQHVKVGDIIGKVGNTGGSFVPHLHLQAMNKPSMTDAEGLPFVVSSFDVIGACPVKGFVYEARKIWHSLKIFFGLEQDYTLGTPGKCIDYLQPKHYANEPLGDYEIIRFKAV